MARHDVQIWYPECKDHHATVWCAKCSAALQKAACNAAPSNAQNGDILCVFIRDADTAEIILITHTIFFKEYVDQFRLDTGSTT